jgi:hypothetical protein
VVYKSFKFGTVGDTDYVVESNVLERNLDYSFLEVSIVQDLKSISVDEQELITFNLSMS